MNISNVKSRINKSNVQYNPKDVDLLITDPKEIVYSENGTEYTAQYIVDNSPSSDKIWSIMHEDILDTDNKGTRYKAISHRPYGHPKKLPYKSYTVLYQYLMQPVNISYDIPLNIRKNKLFTFEPKLSYKCDEKLDIIYSVEFELLKKLPRKRRQKSGKGFDDLFNALVVRELLNQPNKFEKLNKSGKYNDIINEFLAYSGQSYSYINDLSKINLKGFTKFIEKEYIHDVPRRAFNQIMMEYYILSYKKDKYMTEYAGDTGLFILRPGFVPYLISFYTAGDMAKYNYTSSIDEDLLSL